MSNARLPARSNADDRPANLASKKEAEEPSV
jgi:hypothetical protein